MRHPGLGLRLVAGADRDPHPDRDGANRLDVLPDDRQAGRKHHAAEPLAIAQRSLPKRQRRPWPPLGRSDAGYAPSFLPTRVLWPPTSLATSAIRRPAGPRSGLLAGRLVAGQRLLAAQLDLAFAVDADHLDEDGTALVDHV